MAAVSLDSFVSAGDDLDLSAPGSGPTTAPAGASASGSASVLAVGSQAAAQDGSYQQLVTQLGAKGVVDTYMIDRITEGGECRGMCIRCCWETEICQQSRARRTGACARAARV